MLINRQANLEKLCEQLHSGLKGSAAPLAIDTEFISERRYFPRLCLVQLRAEAGEGISESTIEAVIDPLAVDLTPLFDIVADASIIKVFHAGAIDLQVLFQEYGCTARSSFDTQIAAAFLGYGHQVGYADLVRRLLDGPSLSKDLQFSDWSARPLSPAQIDYALADVRYLPQMYTVLRRQLIGRGRLEWAEIEFRRAETKAGETMPDNEIYRKFNLSGLSRRQLAALRELAATREALARSLNKPPGAIVSDPTLLQMAKQLPGSISELRSLRGMPSIGTERLRDFLAALKRAERVPEDQLPELNIGQRPHPQLEAVTGLLGVVAQLRAAEHDVSRTYLASREQLVAVATWWLRGESTPPPDIALLSDWRRDLLGNELLDLLQGRLAVTLDATPEQPAIRVVRLGGEVVG